MMVFHLPPSTVSANSVGQLKRLANGRVITHSGVQFRVFNVTRAGLFWLLKPHILTRTGTGTANRPGEIALKVLAILSLKAKASFESVRAELANEIRCSWSLFATGVLREAYATEIPSRVVFVIEADDMAAAERQLVPLPLIAAGLFDVEFMELRPFVNWSMLFARESGN